MDLVSGTGIALAGVSLAFQTFSGCIKGYQLLIEARDMPKTHEYLRTRLLLEQYKLLNWAVVSKLWYRNPSTQHGGLMQPNEQAIIAVLEQIRSLLLDIDSIRERYKLTIKVDDTCRLAGQPYDDSWHEQYGPQFLQGDYRMLWREALKSPDERVGWPRKLRWATFDAGKFNILLEKLQGLNTDMTYFLDAHEKRQLRQGQENINMQILEVNNKVDQLLHLFKPTSAETASGDVPKLARMARFKALNVAVEGGIIQHTGISSAGLELPLATNLDKSLLKLNTTGHEPLPKPARSGAIYGDIPVWVEWKYYDAENDHSWIETRISRLSILLRDPKKPEEFRVPNCLGYFQDVGSRRFGFVFRSQLPAGPMIPQSLYSTITGTMKPPLTQRVSLSWKIASSLGHLHATNWLHKGLRSDNVLLMASDDVSSPTLSGFEYSRPANRDEITELPSMDRLQELYRHPDVQFDVPRDGNYGFAKIHDIYSLGVVLFEVGVWHPIHDLLMISPHELIRRPVLRGVREKLLASEKLGLLRAEVGDKFAEATRLCLAGEFSTTDDEMNTGVQVQANFREKVVDVLACISV